MSPTVQYLLLPMAILVFGTAGFVFATATKAHHTHCERTCRAQGEIYTWNFALAPVHSPACVCVHKK